MPSFGMLEMAERRRKFFTDKMECKIPQQKGKERVVGSLTFAEILGETDTEFIDLVGKCL